VLETRAVFYKDAVELLSSLRETFWPRPVSAISGRSCRMRACWAGCFVLIWAENRCFQLPALMRDGLTIGNCRRSSRS